MPVVVSPPDFASQMISEDPRVAAASIVMKTVVAGLADMEVDMTTTIAGLDMMTVSGVLMVVVTTMGTAVLIATLLEVVVKTATIAETIIAVVETNIMGVRAAGPRGTLLPANHATLMVGVVAVVGAAVVGVVETRSIALMTGTHADDLDC